LKTRQPAVLDLDKAREVLRAGETQVAHPVTKLALRLLVLTVIRPGVLRATTWSEINQAKDNVWRIPAARMKLGLQSKRHESWDFWVPLARRRWRY
jgi:integrase